MLSLKNFEQQVGRTLLEKGRNYYENGAVISLEETGIDHWQAEVEGTETYEADVRLKGNNITDYFCNCPYEGDLCKHIVAVLFAIREETNKPGHKKERASEREAFENLLRKISLEEYQEFIRQYASGHKEFKTEFELRFAAKDKRIDVGKQYEALIRKIIRKHTDHGFIDYRATYPLYKEVGDLLETGKGLVKKNNFSEAFVLAKTVLKEMMEVVGNCDDSSGNIGAVISDAIGLIETILDGKETHNELKEQIYAFSEAELNRKVYFDYGDVGYELFDLFKRLAIALNKHPEFLRFIDNQLPKLKGEYDDYHRNFFKTQKIDFLKETGRKAEAETLIQQNLDIVEVRQQEVNKAIAKKDFAAAKKLIAGGITIAEKEGHPGTVSQWEKELLRLAVLEKDKETIRYYTKRFAFDRGFSKEYYQQWKKTFTAEEWKAVIEELIEEKTRQIEKEEEKSKGRFWHAPQQSLLHALAPIYIEEKYWDRLLELVAKANSFDMAWQYHDHLVKAYPLALLEIYVGKLEPMGDKANQRSDYADLVWKMKKIIKDIPAGEEKIVAIAQRLKEKYPRRPAMVDELNKILK